MKQLNMQAEMLTEREIHYEGDLLTPLEMLHHEISRCDYMKLGITRLHEKSSKALLGKNFLGKS